MIEVRFRGYSWGVLGYSLLVILWGYFLRVSESGDGCGTDWPLCHGEVLPAGAPFPTWVEFIHRISSGIVLLLVIGMAVWAFRRFPRGSLIRRGAGAALLFTLTESLFGAVLVVFGLVAGDASTARILIRPFHVTNTFALMAALALTAWWATRPVERIRSLRSREGRPFLLGLLGLLALAWTGSWTGLAGTVFPAESVREGMGQYLDPEHLLIYLRVAHPVVALLVLAFLGRIGLSIRREAQGRREAGSILEGGLALGVLALAGLQLLLGPLTILLLYPTSLRLAHLVAADLLWIAFLLIASERLGLSAARSSPPPPAPVRTGPEAARP